MDDPDRIARDTPAPSVLSEAYGYDQPDVLMWLQAWFSVNCNGDWEHGAGITIGSLDNPGWTVKIDIEFTPLEHVRFARREVHRSEHDWLVARVEDRKWHLDCGPLNLAEGLHHFRVWASQAIERPILEAATGDPDPFVERIRRATAEYAEPDDIPPR